MVCQKCGYSDKKEVEKFGIKLCQFCNFFAPEEKEKFDEYILEKHDWKSLETFRKFGQTFGTRQKAGMKVKAKEGKIMTRVALGYTLSEGVLITNEFSSKIHSIFRTFIEKDYSLNSMSKYYGLSVNGLKKVLRNRTYLGEVKFDGQIHKGPHKPIISPEIFYAAQRKLQEISRVRKK